MMGIALLKNKHIKLFIFAVIAIGMGILHYNFQEFYTYQFWLPIHEIYASISVMMVLLSSLAAAEFVTTLRDSLKAYVATVTSVAFIEYLSFPFIAEYTSIEASVEYARGNYSYFPRVCSIAAVLFANVVLLGLAVGIVKRKLIANKYMCGIN